MSDTEEAQGLVAAAEKLRLRAGKVVNELIELHNTVRFDYWNTQEQRRFVWPPSFAKARAFVDQLERSKGLSAGRLTAVRDALAKAEGATGAARRTALGQLATSLAADARSSSDREKVDMLIAAVKELAQ